MQELDIELDSKTKEYQVLQPEIENFHSWNTQRQQNQKEFENIKVAQSQCLIELFQALTSNLQQHQEREVDIESQIILMEEEQARECQQQREKCLKKQKQVKDKLRFQQKKACKQVGLQVQLKTEIHAIEKDHLPEVISSQNNVDNQLQSIEQESDQLKVLQSENRAKYHQIEKELEELVKSYPSLGQLEQRMIIWQQKEQLEQEQKKLEDHQQDYIKRKERHQQNVIQMKTKQQVLRSGCIDIQEEINEFSTNLQQLKLEKQRNQSEIQELMNQRQNQAVQLSNLEKNDDDTDNDCGADGLNRRQQLQKKRRQSRELKNIMIGFVSEIFVIPHPLKMAVEAALGSILAHDVVVGDRQHAIQVTHAYRKNQWGRISCHFPMNGANNVSLSCPCLDHHKQPSIEEENTNADYQGRLCKWVQWNSTFGTSKINHQKMIHQLCHQWYIVPSPDEAIRLRQQKKFQSKHFVTWNGVKFLVGGEIQSTRNHQSKSQQPGRNKRHDKPQVESSCTTKVPPTSTGNVEEMKQCIARYTEEIQKKRQDESKRNVKMRKLELEMKKKYRCLGKTVDDAALEERRIQKEEHYRDTIEEEFQSFYQNQIDDMRQKLSEIQAILRTDDPSSSDSSAQSKELSILKACTNANAELQMIREQLKTTEYKLEVMFPKQLEQYQSQKQRFQERANELALELKVKTQQLMSCTEELELQHKEKAQLKQSLELLQETILKLHRQEKQYRDQIQQLCHDQERTKQSIQTLLQQMEQYQQDKFSLNVTEKILDTNVSTNRSMDELVQDYEVMKTKMSKNTHQRSILEHVRQTISVDDVSRALRIQHDIESNRSASERIFKLLERCQAERLGMETCRFNRVTKALARINEQLLVIYKEFCQHGECYLRFAKEKGALFKDGIEFHCKPNAKAQWQEFYCLSGGQQAICALSLTLALQHVYPCPLYVCDEIDASLDCDNVSKLASVLVKISQEQSHLQCIIVSHRWRMWIRLPVLIGVFTSATGTSSLSKSNEKNHRAKKKNAANPHYYSQTITWSFDEHDQSSES